VAVARRHSLPLRVSRPRPLDDVLTAEDLIVTVCDNAHEELGTSDRSGHGDLHWSVPDPVPAGTKTAFDDAFSELTRRVGDLADRLHIS
jgi:protein-tyrosine-phosphatase